MTILLKCIETLESLPCRTLARYAVIHTIKGLGSSSIGPLLTIIRSLRGIRRINNSNYFPKRLKLYWMRRSDRLKLLWMRVKSRRPLMRRLKMVLISNRKLYRSLQTPSQLLLNWRAIISISLLSQPKRDQLRGSRLTSKFLNRRSLTISPN
jgi:hypothetical protein